MYIDIRECKNVRDDQLHYIALRANADFDKAGASILTLAARGPNLDVRIWRLQTSDSDV